MNGYSPVGKQLRVKRSLPRMTTMSSIVVASCEEVIQRVDRNGSFNTISFCSFLESLNVSRGTVVLLDNVSFHHSKAAKAIAESKGLVLLFTPPYSPWFNPIEGIFSIVKREYYKDGSIERAFKTVNRAHCQAFFQKSLTI